MKNFIQIEGKQFTLTPTTKDEYIEMCSAIVTVLGVTAANTTDTIKDDKERVEAILRFVGQCAADAGKFAVSIIADEKAKEEAIKKAIKGAKA